MALNNSNVKGPATWVGPPVKKIVSIGQNLKKIAENSF